jgi:hypothetical protein
VKRSRGEREGIHDDEMNKTLRDASFIVSCKVAIIRDTRSRKALQGKTRRIGHRFYWQAVDELPLYGEESLTPGPPVLARSGQHRPTAGPEVSREQISQLLTLYLEFRIGFCCLG